MGAKRNAFSTKTVFHRFPVPLGKMPSLIKFCIGRNICLGNNPQDLPILQYRCHIVQVPIPLKGQSHHHKGIPAPGDIRNLK